MNKNPAKVSRKVSRCDNSPILGGVDIIAAPLFRSIPDIMNLLAEIKSSQSVIDAALYSNDKKRIEYLLKLDARLCSIVEAYEYFTKEAR